jgi:CRISPR/Cas system-associated endonuclease Cas1
VPLMSRSEPVVTKALRRRVAVHFLDDAGSFIGRLAEFDSETYVLEQCETVAAPNEVPQPIKGRLYVDRINCWLQELPT